jgi:hypothetical protein
MTCSAITVGSFDSAQGSPQVGLHTAGIDGWCELFHDAGNELLAGARFRGAALRDDPRNRSQRGKEAAAALSTSFRASARCWRAPSILEAWEPEVAAETAP